MAVKAIGFQVGTGEGEAAQLVLELRRAEGLGGVAQGAIPGERRTGMIGIRGGIGIGLMAGCALIIQPGEQALPRLHMTGSAFGIPVRASQAESTQSVIETGRVPIAGLVADRAVPGQGTAGMVRISGILRILLVAGSTGGVQTAEARTAVLLVTRGTLGLLVSSGQREGAAEWSNWAGAQAWIV